MQLPIWAITNLRNVFCLFSKQIKGKSELLICFCIRNFLPHLKFLSTTFYYLVARVQRQIGWILRNQFLLLFFPFCVLIICDVEIKAGVSSMCIVRIFCVSDRDYAMEVSCDQFLSELFVLSKRLWLAVILGSIGWHFSRDNAMHAILSLSCVRLFLFHIIFHCLYCVNVACGVPFNLCWWPWEKLLTQWNCKHTIYLV